MATISRTRTNEHVSAVPRAHPPNVADGDLLDQFIVDQDETAFAELVRRHGPMVLGVCRRVLHNGHDAEDCFQAVFLVLVRKAATIQPRQMVGNWLYGVAYRTALEARKLAARRRNMERKKPVPTPNDESASELWREFGPLLDQELSRLPDKYRAVLVASDIECKTRHEVARELGLPEGTVASRLARARALLAKRMAKHSFAMTTAGLAGLLADRAADAVPAHLLTATIKAGAKFAGGKPDRGTASSQAALLADRVVNSLALAKLKVASAVLLILLALGIGISALIPSAHANRKPNAHRPDDQKGVVEKKKKKYQIARDCVLQKIDLADHTIRAEEVGGTDSSCGGTYEMRIGPETEVLIDGRAAELADLKVGAAVDMHYRLDADGQQHAVRIEATGAYLGGVVHAISEQSVTIQTEGVESVQKTYAVENGACVLVDGKKTRLADLKVKMRVTLKTAAGKAQVVGIDASGPKVKGAVKSVEIDKKSISLQPDGAAPAEAITVADDAPVISEGKKSRLAELKAGTRIAVRLSADPDVRIAVAIVVLAGKKEE